MAYFLNALYTMFDSVTDKYNIFKVLNINHLLKLLCYQDLLKKRCSHLVLFDVQVDKVNDTHMIASGVPEKNGDKHAPGALKDHFHFETLYLYHRDCYNGIGFVEHLFWTSNSRQKPTD